MPIFLATIRRDLRIKARNVSELLNPLAFYVIAVTLFPLAMGPGSDLLAAAGPGILWVTALLATLLALDSLFRSDHEDGSLEQMVIAPQSLIVIGLAKVTSHWLATGLPLTVFAPVLGYMLALPEDALWAIVFTLLLGTPTLSLVGAIGAALTVGISRGSVLIAIVVLPLYVPVLILGAAAVGTAMQGFSIAGHLYWLAALLTLSLGLAPFGIAAALRISSSS